VRTPALRSACALAAALLAAVPAAAQQNLSFELGDLAAPLGWSIQRVAEVAEIGEVAVDGAVAAVGARSLRITQRRADDFVRVGQRLPIAAVARASAGPRRVRLSATLRAPSSRGAEAALWIRISGRKGVLFVDSRGDGRERPDFADPVLDAPAAPSAAAPVQWRRRDLELPLPDDAAEIEFGAVLRGVGTAWFDDFAISVAPVAGSAPSAAAVRYLDAALDLAQRHSLNRTAVDWAQLRRATLEQARGAVVAADTYPALRYALRELGDRHSYLLAPGPAAALLAAPVSNARTGRAAVEPDAQVLAERFAYLAVPGFAGGTPAAQVGFAEVLQADIASLDASSTCGWILDLRRNTGGNLWPMFAGLGPLLGDGELAASVYPDGSRRGIWYEQGRAGFGDYVQLRVATPHALRDPGAPLAVLLGGRTASSAEVLVAALRGRARTRSFGAPTAGLSAGNRTFELADRAQLVLTVAATSDRAGRIDLGPIDPDEPVGEPVLAAALAWLQTQEPCR
jgi:hypothetical protein